MPFVRYLLRASPAKGADGKYATSHGENELLDTEARKESLLEEQSWFPREADLQGRVRVELHKTLTTTGLGWGFDGKHAAETPLALTTRDKQILWYSKKHPAAGVDNAYVFQPSEIIPPLPPGLYFAGTDTDGKVIIKGVKLETDPKDYPYWVLEEYRTNDEGGAQ
ncbi:hypothetical protein HGRIS_011052 [Hohenbuehelia grisea]